MKIDGEYVVGETSVWMPEEASKIRFPIALSRKASDRPNDFTALSRELTETRLRHPLSDDRHRIGCLENGKWKVQTLRPLLPRHNLVERAKSEGMKFKEITFTLIEPNRLAPNACEDASVLGKVGATVYRM